MFHPTHITGAELVEALTPQLAAKPAADDLRRLKFVEGSYFAHISHGDTKQNPLFELSVECLITPEKRRAPKIAVPTQPYIELVAENIAHKLAKALTINKEFQSGDDQFDSGVYIYSNKLPDNYIRSLLKDSKTRDAITKLLRHGYDVITIDVEEQRCTVSATRGERLELLVEGAVVSDHTLLLGLIGDAAPRYVAERARSTFNPWPIAVVSTWVIGALLLVTTDITDMSWHITAASMDRPWQIAAAASIIIIALGAASLRNSSRTLQKVFTVSLFLAVSIPTFQVTTLRAVNALADRGPATLTPIKVVELKRVAGRRGVGITYFATTSLNDERMSVRRAISVEAHDTLTRCGDRCGVYVRPGALGWPWLDGYAPLDAAH
jgi:hypothetical protein